VKRNVRLSSTFVRQYRKLAAADQKRVRAALDALAEDATTSRTGADIKRLAKTKPTKHRVRVGPYRVIYRIDGDSLHVIEVFARGRGYRQ
jgi:mRNA-degrading endonuclease RelE of RelBE toxin-antitoxin system